MLTLLPSTPASAVTDKASHFYMKGASKQATSGALRDYIVKAEKVLYYTLERVKGKLHSNAEYFFADACDALICSRIHESELSNVKRNFASIFNTGSSNVMLLHQSRQWSVRDVSHLKALSPEGETPCNQQPEYTKMILSSLLVLYNLPAKDVTIYEEDSDL